MFKNLTNLAIQEIEQNKETAKNNIDLNLKSVLNAYATKHRQEQYNNNKITEEKAKEIAVKAIEKYYNKFAKKTIDNIDLVAKAETLEEFELYIDYKKTVKAYLTINNKKEYCASASNQTNGDQLSAATASVLNASFEVKKALYIAKEKLMQEGIKDTYQIREIIGYGSGYTLPYIESVGVDSIINIFNNLGYKVQYKQLNKAKLYRIYIQ